jgi:hypothetical protein
MDEKDVNSSQVEHYGRDKQALKLEKVQQRTNITNDIPLQKALKNHLNKDPKQLKRVKWKVDLPDLNARFSIYLRLH